MKYKKLSDLTCKIGSGVTPRGGEKAYIENGKTVLIRSQNIYNHTFTPEGLVYITEEQAEKMKGVEIESNDILMNITGDSVARVTVVPKEFIPSRVNQHVSIIRCNKNIDPYYILAVLTSNNMQRYLISIAKTGGTRAALTKKMIENIEIPILPAIYMDKISNIYKIIFEKIELNNQMIDILEEVASTLFKRWFVDFEFPDENGNPYKSSGGKMIDSELGEIPEGWGVSSIEKISKNVVTGKTPSTKNKEFYGGNIPFITIPDMHNKTFIVESERYLTEEGKIENKILPRNSICVSCIATPGLAVFNSIESQTNQQINSIIPHDIDRYWLFLNIKGKRQLIRDLGSGGSTTLNLNKTQFGKIQLISPTFEVKEKFNERVKSLFDLILENSKENVILVNSRDTLLPKLLSGEIEV